MKNNKSDAPDKYKNETDHRKIPREYLNPPYHKDMEWLNGKRLLYINLIKI